MIAGGSAGPTIGEIGEFALIDAILQSVPADPDRTRTVVGPGDDAAVLAARGEVVLATDAMVEGVHFRRDWSEPGDIGRKVVAVNVADLEAMGATPVGLMLSLSAPADLPLSWVTAFRDGVLAECETAGIRLIGGDTTASTVLTIVGSTFGDMEGRTPLTRSGATVGQKVAVKGRLGWAAAGLRALSRGFRSPRVVVEAQRCPEVPYGAGREAVAAGATSLIDVSDGLVADLGHVANASGVSIELTTANLDIAEPLQAVASATGGDPVQLVLTGGEDHALVGTFETVPAGWVELGVVTEAGEAGSQVLVDGEVPDWPSGHDHFAR
ncbi:MAG TPA: thiamine-phosphate kinase [Candidatus Avipropionibacterium avicola]|uniref:Thiamine-monophosphate kinase n=1 Tax=Candidatus Avipropionibacterium avicola TaxID=2840701 RepID=A0A9D1GXX5_9ACTN|nr:thiamine-phosphate kinase [Candidatus Avipropionibacterium avicola]